MRLVQTESIPASESSHILDKQRLLRPNSPHLTIYQPQVTSVLSIGNRAAGVALSVVLYGFSLGYLFMPGTLDSASIIAVAAALPVAVKYAAKTILAAPFAFHSFNGIRHLSWDLGKFLSIRAVYAGGYAVLGATAVGTAALVLM
ncbi:hypothetical protein C8J56DRAFT_780393 [Mycena floridula]|nr:hypothetical protein C8J56DRAFT_780393 [Mycena floridula]